MSTHDKLYASLSQGWVACPPEGSDLFPAELMVPPGLSAPLPLPVFRWSRGQPEAAPQTKSGASPGATAGRHLPSWGSRDEDEQNDDNDDYDDNCNHVLTSVHNISL